MFRTYDDWKTTPPEYDLGPDPVDEVMETADREEPACVRAELERIAALHPSLRKKVEDAMRWL